jgi:subtilisin family serine protease
MMPYHASHPAFARRGVAVTAIVLALSFMVALSPLSADGTVSGSGADQAGHDPRVRIIIGFEPGIDVAAAISGVSATPSSHPTLAVDLDYLGASGLLPKPLVTIPRAVSTPAASKDSLRLVRRWASVTLPAGADVGKTLALLRGLPSVRQAFIQPEVRPAVRRASLAAATPKFVRDQQYLDAPPDGVGARGAWKKGFLGNGVSVADVEGDWVNSHHDLRTANAAVINGVRAASSLWYDHGTAEIGLVIGTRNQYGITGIAHKARILLFSIYREGEDGEKVLNIPEAITHAALALKPGDIIYLPIEYRDEFTSGRGFPVEYYDDVYEAILFAVDRGLVVIEAAGNGGLNLDGSLFDGKFGSANRDSGAIIVGAGGTPDYRDRKRLSFSSYGTRVNVQNWGEDVVTTGYGTLFDGGPTRTYTGSFNGTSSATGITAGVAALLQQCAREKLGRSLTSREMRSLLMRTGSPQKNPSTGHIGPRPDLQKALADISSMNDE